MAIKLTITQIGEPKDIQTKFGPKQKSYVKATEYPDKFLNYWLGEQTKSWKVGDVVEVEAVDKREYTGQDGTLKTSYEIKLPRNDMGKILARLEEIEGKITKLSLRVSALEPKREVEDGIYEDPDVQAEAESLRKEYDEQPPF